MGRPAEVAGTETPDPVRDDRVLLATRWTGRIIAPILMVAFGMLCGFPDRTTELFARGDFDAANPLTWTFLGGFLLYLLALLAVYYAMERRDGAAPRPGRGGEPSR